MKKNWLLAAGLALVLVTVGLAGCGGSDLVLEGVEGIAITTQQQGIWVSGQGEVSAVPDIVNLRLGVEAQEATAAEAREQASAAMDSVMTALTDNGVAESDIQTQYFNISQITRWDGDKDEVEVVGYEVTNTVIAKIRDVEDTGAIIDAVVEAGGDLIRINSISFSIDDPSTYYEQVRAEAMADAEAKAEQLAELGGVTLGSPTYISEGSIYVPSSVYRGMDYAMEEEGGEMIETPISPGEIDITLSVQVGYAIR